MLSTCIKRRALGAFILAATAAIAVGSAGPAAAAVADCPANAVHTYLPPGHKSPFGIAAGPGGTWFARHDAIERIPSGGGNPDIVSYHLPEGGSASAGWVATRGAGSQAEWFTTRGTGRLGTVTVAGAIHEYQVPAGPAGTAVPQSLVFGPGKIVWFTDQQNNRIGRFDPTTMTFGFYLVPTPDALPLGMIAGPDGALYFTERSVDKVGRLDPATGLFTEWSLTPGAFPNRLAVTPDGNVWFTELLTDELGYLDPTGHLHEIAASGGPVGLTYSNGSLYAALYGAGELGQFDLSGTLTHTWTLPGAHGALQVAASDGYLWVTDGFGQHVYRVDVTCG